MRASLLACLALTACGSDEPLAQTPAEASVHEQFLLVTCHLEAKEHPREKRSSYCAISDKPYSVAQLEKQADYERLLTLDIPLEKKWQTAHDACENTFDKKTGGTFTYCAMKVDPQNLRDKREAAIQAAKAALIP
jgi:hypothetical protein